MSNIEKTIASAFMEVADIFENKTSMKKGRIALTMLGSEHPEENALSGALIAAKHGVDVVVIGTLEHEGVTTMKATTEEEAHTIMDDLLKSGEVDAAVTMHYPFPIGVSTVGRVVTPSIGREMFIATTTGTSSLDRTEGLVKNAISGITAAKACGIAKPTVGILNIDGARQAEGILKELVAGGYDINFATSGRSDGGCVMRGNDVLAGTPDVLICDPLTGNVMMKMLSSYTTGGSYEALGYGYGPGIGDGYDKVIMIISRASGAPVIANAIIYASELALGKVKEVAKKEYDAAKKAGLNKILDSKKNQPKEASDEVVAPPTEVVTAQISGIEIMDLEDGVKVLWKEGIYAQSGMGCTGPIILVSDSNLDKSVELLKKAGYIS